MYVTKASGKKEKFNSQKVVRSLRRAGVSGKVQGEVLAELEKHIFEGISTKAIYLMVNRILKKYAKSEGLSRYSLKRAIMDLGPTGFPFEKFLGALLAHEGFHVQIGKTVQGYCIRHEIDVIAEKGNKHFMIEAKYHNNPGRKTDSKVALYVYGRFLDVERAWKARESGAVHKFHQAWVVTNTRLTSEAIRFCNCVGMRAVGWKYPRNEGLEVMVERSGLYPVTILSSLSRKYKRKILEQGIVLCRDLVRQEARVRGLGLDRNKITAAIAESRAVCRMEKYPKMK